MSKENTPATGWLDENGHAAVAKYVESGLGSTQFQVHKPIPIAGCYRLGKDTINCIKFLMTYKPNRIHRFFMRILLGWYWEDNK